MVPHADCDESDPYLIGVETEIFERRDLTVDLDSPLRIVGWKKNIACTTVDVV